MKVVRIDNGRLIPSTFTLVVSLGLFFIYRYLFLYTGKITFVGIGLFLSPILPAIWSARIIFEINPSKQEWGEYYWILGFKFGRSKPFPSQIEKIYINEVPMARLMTSHGGHVNTERFKEYAAFIKFQDGSKHELVRRRDKKTILRKMEEVSTKLGTTLSDNS